MTPDEQATPQKGVEMSMQNLNPAALKSLYRALMKLTGAVDGILMNWDYMTECKSKAIAALALAESTTDAGSNGWWCEGCKIYHPQDNRRCPALPPTEPIDWDALETAHKKWLDPHSGSFLSSRFFLEIAACFPLFLAYHKHAQDALNYAYQLAGAVDAGVEALDNLSAVAHGDVPPHPWPVAQAKFQHAEEIRQAAVNAECWLADLIKLTAHIGRETNWNPKITKQIEALERLRAALGET